nr:histidinol dehydrogenase [Nakamurella aerolata]
MQRIDLTGGRARPPELATLLERAASITGADDAVAPILTAVREHGAAAVLDAGERFDGVRPAALRVPADVLSVSLQGLDPALRGALTEMIERVRKTHQAQLPQPAETHLTPGGTVTQRWIPVRRVGLYVPGGLAVYPSSVVMNVVPAQVAGVDEIVVCSPPQAGNGGWPDPAVLAACALLGVSEVYAAGGAQAIALLGYGSSADSTGSTDNAADADSIAAVDVITGPGNAYVTAAKRALRGTVAIDSEAGPTEIAVLADDSADPRLIAADLISQAEHSPDAASVLITDSAQLADAVLDALPDLVAATTHAERVRQALSGQQSAVVLTADLDAAVALTNEYAAEHLEIQTRHAGRIAQRIRNAGAIFLGPYSPVSLGDYCAGSNHVLPTAGGARYSSGLNTTTFLKSVQVIDYSAAALAAVAPSVVVLADAEDLPAHGAAVTARFDQAVDGEAADGEATGGAGR